MIDCSGLAVLYVEGMSGAMGLLVIRCNQFNHVTVIARASRMDFPRIDQTVAPSQALRLAIQ